MARGRLLGGGVFLWRIASGRKASPGRSTARSHPCQAWPRVEEPLVVSFDPEAIPVANSRAATAAETAPAVRAARSRRGRSRCALPGVAR